GRRVVYLPEVAILHYENASAVSGNEPRALYHRNLPYFTQKHADWLACQPPFGTPRLAMRESQDDRFKVLYLPSCKTVSGAEKNSSDITEAVRRLQGLNCFVTVYPLDVEEIVSSQGIPNLPPDVEVLPGGSLASLPEFLAERREYYDGLLTNDAGMVEPIKQ